MIGPGATRGFGSGAAVAGNSGTGRPAALKATAITTLGSSGRCVCPSSPPGGKTSAVLCEPSESLEPHGFVGLAFFEAGARSLYTVKRPVRSIDDIKGLRIRLQQSDLMIEMFAS